MSLVGPELGALARSRCLDSGSALMGFRQITVITLVVEIQDGFAASQTAFGFIHRCGPAQWLRNTKRAGRISPLPKYARM